MNERVREQQFFIQPTLAEWYGCRRVHCSWHFPETHKQCLERSVRHGALFAAARTTHIVVQVVQRVRAADCDVHPKVCGALAHGFVALQGIRLRVKLPSDFVHLPLLEHARDLGLRVAAKHVQLRALGAQTLVEVIERLQQKVVAEYANPLRIDKVRVDAEDRKDVFGFGDRI